MKLEYVDTLVLAHPFVKSFDRVNYCLDDQEQHAVCIGEVPQQMEGRTEKDLIDAQAGGQGGKGGIYWTTTFYIGLQIERKPGQFCSPLALSLCGGEQVRQRGRRDSADARESISANASGPRKLDISYPTNEFTKLVKMWDKYDADTMGVIVRYIKSFVFFCPLDSQARDVQLIGPVPRLDLHRSALPAYVHAGREPEPPKTGGLKRAKSKVRHQLPSLSTPPSQSLSRERASFMPSLDPYPDSLAPPGFLPPRTNDSTPDRCFHPLRT